MQNHIDHDGFPLGFKTQEGSHPCSLQTSREASEKIKVEARQMFHHQKEAIVTEGQSNTIWRLCSDEGLHLKGTDLAPFPLGFFNAGIQGDLFQRIYQVALRKNIQINEVNISLSNHYWLTGSFVLGTGEGHAEPTKISFQVKSNASKDRIKELIHEATQASPAIHFLKHSLKNRFALYINGRRKSIHGLLECEQENALDPFLIYTHPPQPIKVKEPLTVLTKLPILENGEIQTAANTIAGKQLRNVLGVGSWSAKNSYATMQTWLEMPGTTHFEYRTAIGENSSAPTGLSLISAGISFCFMTQLSRYIENMKMDISGVRLVQYSPYAVKNNIGQASPIETHLFLNGNAPEEIHSKLLEIAERTCYLHVTACTPLEPEIEILYE